MAKTLREITEDVQIIEVIGDIDIPISGISYDTRDKIEAKGCFVAMRGTTFDGHTYIHDGYNLYQSRKYIRRNCQNI